MFNMRVSKSFLILLLVFVCFLFVQCEKKPTAQIEISQSLLKKMQSEESSHYAPEKYEMAMNYYNKAQDLLGKKDYKKASVQLEYFINVANAALSKTQNEKDNEKYKQKEADIVYAEATEGQIDTLEAVEEKSVSMLLSEPQTHVVMPGENLSVIAKKYYQFDKFWKDIFEANKYIIANPDIIYPGQELKIPVIETKTVLDKNEYQVEEGESLWSISEKLFPGSSTNRWRLIYKENKDKLYNPNILKYGLIIVVPDLTEYEYSAGDTTYLVKSGDSFWSIAKMMNSRDTSKSVNWQDIFYLNMAELSDSNSIYPDQIIKLP